jgi:hypothetical protein
VAADKTHALYGRAAARYLVDVAALSERYTLEQLSEIAAEKGTGFDRRVFADALAAAAAHSDAAFAELGLQSETVAALRASTARWRAQLLDAADMCARDAVRSFGGRTPPGGRRLRACPALRDHLNVIGRHPSNAGRDGRSPSR